MFDQVAPKSMALFMVGLVFEASLLMRPARVAELAGPDAWLAPFVALVCEGGLALLGVWVAAHFPEETYVDYGQRLLGRWPGRAVALLLILFWLFKMAEAALVAARTVQIYLLPHTPAAIVVGAQLVAALYLAWSGIGPAVRLAELTVPGLVLLILVTMAVALPSANFGYLRPVLHHGWRPVFAGACELFSHLQGLEVLLLLYPFLSRKRAAAGVVVAAALIREVTMLVLIVVPIMVLSVSDTAHQVFPVLTTARSVELQALGLERLDSLFMGVWLIAAYLPVAFRLYLISFALAHLWGGKDHRPFLFPVVAACAALVAIPQNPLQFERYQHGLSWLGASASAVVPLLLSLGVLLRRRGRDASCTHN